MHTIKQIVKEIYGGKFWQDNCITEPYYEDGKFAGYRDLFLIPHAIGYSTLSDWNCWELSNYEILSKDFDFLIPHWLHFSQHLTVPVNLELSDDTAEEFYSTLDYLNDCLVLDECSAEEIRTNWIRDAFDNWAAFEARAALGTNPDIDELTAAFLEYECMADCWSALEGTHLYFDAEDFARYYQNDYMAEMEN